MAVTRSDIERWILNAEDEVEDDIPGQIAWLREKRKDYAVKVDGGDYEITSDSLEGANTQGRRGISDRDNHDAIVGAIDVLKGRLGTGGKRRGTVLGFRIKHITG